MNTLGPLLAGHSGWGNVHILCAHHYTHTHTCMRRHIHHNRPSSFLSLSANQSNMISQCLKKTGMCRWTDERNWEKEGKNSSLEESEWAQSSLSAGVALPVCADLLLCEHRPCSVCERDPAALPALHQSPTSPPHTMRLQSAIPPYAQHAACMQKAALRSHTLVCSVFSWALY